MEKQKLAAEESDAETERARMMDWLKTYHELRETEENSGQARIESSNSEELSNQ